MGDITTAFVNQYKAGITLLNQQMGSRLRPFVRVEDQTGESAFYDQLAPTSANRRTDRNATRVPGDPDHRRRRVTLANFDVNHYIDRFDEPRFLNNPQGAYQRNQAMAIGRAVDDSLITAALGTAYTGKEGGTSVTLPNAQIIGVQFGESPAADAGLTLAKLKEVRETLRADMVDGQIFMAITAVQMTDLLNITQVTSKDFNETPTLVEGKVVRYLGINFIEIHSSLLPTPTDAAHRRCVAWVQEGVLLAANPELEVTIDRDRSRVGSPIFVETISIHGATRMHEEWVVAVDCQE